MNKTHSFSTKTDLDHDMVAKAKAECRRSGMHFSWYILQAIKTYELCAGNKGIANEHGRKD